MTTLSPELEGIIGNTFRGISDICRSLNDRWIYRLWEIYQNRDFDAFESHLKTAPLDIDNPADVLRVFPMVNEGETIFGCACSDGRDIKWLEVLLKHGSKQIQAGLNIASRCNRLEIIPWLIEHGADPMQPEPFGFTMGYLPFHHAIAENKFQATMFWAERYPGMIFSSVALQ